MIYTLTLNPAIDRTYLVDGVVVDGVNRVHDIRNEWGGKGINVARALTRSGLPVKAVALLGGSNGRQVAEGVGAEGIDLVTIEINANTRINHVFVNSEGSSIKFNEPGPFVTPGEISHVYRLVENVQKDQGIWVLSGSLPQGASTSIYRHLMDTIHCFGGKVFLDTNGMALEKGLAGLPDWIKPNHEEAMALFPGEQSPKKLCELLIQKGAANVLLSLGADGMLFGSRDELVRVQVPPLAVSNPVAAGDAAVAGFLFGFTQQMNPVDCAKWAAAFGTAAAASHSNCFHSMREVESYFEKIKVDAVR
jgi:1-phosphofructokinase family hexose kinase